ncbi:MAG TPA: hypothetical protein VJR90_02505 [Gammaproteobacteria bacterium]|nr:hypothetical protein [Gammaproteobacteria bacterium]
MQEIIAHPTPVAAQIAYQYEHARIVRRELSGVGFFSHFQVPPDVPTITPPALEVSLHATLSDSPDAIGLTLFVRDGRLAWLEGYTYGNDPWPDHPVAQAWTRVARV